MKKCLITALAAAFCLAAVPVSAAPSAAETPAEIYESFDDYDTLPGRDGTGTALSQMKSESYCGNAAGFDAALGDPVGTDTGHSLRITQKGNKTVNAWANGTKDPAKLDQSGAKYVKFYVRNLSADAKELVTYITDVSERTLEAAADPEYAGTDKIPEMDQEHWCMKWNQAAVLEDLSGERTVVKSTLGMSLKIPKDFEGAVCIPLNTKTLTQPAWWLAENKPCRNDTIDLSRVFAVSFGMIEATNISSEDPASHVVFEVDNVSFHSDSSVDDFIEAARGEDAVKAESVIRPTTDEIAVDYAGETVTVPAGTILEDFKAMFALPAGYRIVVKDKYSFELADTDELTDGCEATFTDDSEPFAFTVKVTGGEEPAPSEEPSASPPPSGGERKPVKWWAVGVGVGCGTLLLAGGAVLAVVLIKKRRIAK